MNRIITTLLCSLVCWILQTDDFSQTAFAQQSQMTTWTGTLDARGKLLRLEIDISVSDGESVGELRSLDQNNATVELNKIYLTKTKLGFSIPRLGAKFSGSLSKGGDVAKGTFTQSGIELPLTISKSTNGKTKKVKLVKSKEVLKAAWIGKLEMGAMNPVMQFRIVELESGKTSAYFDSISEGALGFKATYEIKDKKIRFDVAEIRLKYRGTINDIGMAVGTWSQAGRDFPLTLEEHKVAYDNKNVWENRPQRPSEPYPYDSEEVTFTNVAHDVKLSGTLTIPKSLGRHPVVVLISGSGPQDRDESLMEHKPFLVLADYLTRNGIAVLRYDDRGAFKSTGTFSTASTEDFAYDASAAVEFLKRHERINPHEIGLVGHSEGGLVAPLVTQMRDDIAFVVLMAATGVDGEKISISQGETMLRAAGMSEEKIRTELAVSRAVMKVIKSSKKGDDIGGELNAAVDSVISSLPQEKRLSEAKKIKEVLEGQRKKLDSKWMRYFLNHDPAPVLAKMKCPVLAVIGTKDLQVIPKLNVPAIKNAFSKSGNDDFELVELEGLNHLFQECETGSMDEYASIQETFNPRALKTIGDWILKRTHPID